MSLTRTRGEIHLVLNRCGADPVIVRVVQD